MCCTRIAENTGRKKSPKIRHLGTITQLSQTVSLQLRHISTIRKNVLSSNISSTCPHNMANFSPLTAEIGLPVWGTPANFNGLRVLPSLLQRCRSPEVNQTLHDIWLSPELVHYIYIYIYIYICIYMHFRGLLPPDRILPGAEFTLRPSLVFSYIDSVTAWHSSSGRQSNFAAWYKEWNYGTSQRAPPIFGWASIMLDIGPHSSFISSIV